MAPMINCDSGRMAWNAHPHAALLDGGIAVSNIHASFALRSARRRLHDDGLLCHDRRRAGPQDGACDEYSPRKAVKCRANS